ncbi:hypothetical protein J6590_068032 [Homalodisca vitripennis]|nr:hypothetical protein J6590_068032 [Homalodisca vitripennis]
MRMSNMPQRKLHMHHCVCSPANLDRPSVRTSGVQLELFSSLDFFRIRACALPRDSSSGGTRERQLILVSDFFGTFHEIS